MNDLFVVGLHLKSQKKYIHNHMAAVAKLIGVLKDKDGRKVYELPSKSMESDIMIMGDLNDAAHKRKNFKYIFDYLEAVRYEHMGGDLLRYLATRINGSQIDHIFVSDDLYDMAID